MPAFGPISRNQLIRCVRQCDFQEPYSGGKHRFMTKGTVTIRVPNPHHSDIGRELLARILRQAGIGREEWGLL